MTASPFNPPSSEATASADSGVRRSLFAQAILDTFGQVGARLGMIWIGTLALLAVLAPFIANTYPMLQRLRGGSLTSPMLRSLEPLDVILLILFLNAICVFARRLSSEAKFGFTLWPVLTVSVAAALIRFAVPVVTFQLWTGSSLVGRIWAGVVHLAAAGILIGFIWFWISMSRRYLVALETNPILGGGGILAAVLSLVAFFTVHPPELPTYERFREQERAGQVEFVVHAIIPFSPNDRLFDQREQDLLPPNATHWLGTTQFQEDLLSRMLHACRVTLAIGLIATSISTLIGVVVGGIMGYRAGFTDLIGMRLLEIIESIPRLILLLIVTVSFGRSLYLMMVVIGLVSWTSDARFIRAEFLRLRKLDFVQAATAAGLGRTSILFRHMLPNGIAPVLVNASFGIAGAILLESVLSFLGLGLGAEDPSWGQLLEQATAGGRGFNWWIATFPGLAIFLTVFSYVLIGEAMRDAIDPKLKKSQ